MSKKHKKAHRRAYGEMAGGHPGAAGPMYQGHYGQYPQYGHNGMAADPAMTGMYGASGGFGQGVGDGQGGQGLYDGLQAGLHAAGLDKGLLQGMPAFLRTRNTEQFLLGALIGAAAAWVLSDEELRGKIVKSAIKLYAGVAGGFEEMKEQMSDIRAEVEAERHGDA
ncbi:hypothetical protein ACFQ4M_00570 [Thauera mechernichensis]|uniref:YtxH domain-containing protein n=1 Tax=Thauera mechernichensis TaxID=82788 RepID=A0ABW3WAD8_9RHOO|nr:MULTISPECIES: hypothetical protein [Thauera]ENO92332.1 hypothetical protein C662_12507 [Thauera sp. 28]MDG3063575.1 hypothetical protein [Thauera mechernichensis]HAG75286.1 hypothetical protein [Thauera sp.]HNS93099.1 hypothetical protein [Thauera sp.]